MEKMTIDRRTLLSGAAIAMGGFAFPAGAEAQSDMSSQRPFHGRQRKTFILVHGSWYSSGTWERVSHILVAAGHAVIARDRSAFGLNARFPQSYIDRSDALAQEQSPVAGVTLEQDAALIAGQVREAIEGGSGPVILVGHSAAGIPITSVAEQYPESIANLVYLSALMLDEGVTGAEDFASKENNFQKAFAVAFLGDPTQIGALRVDWNTADPTYFAMLQNTLYADGDAVSFRAATNLFAPDDPLQPYTVPTAKTRARWGSVRRSFIRTDKDVAILPALFDREIAQADDFTPNNKTEVYSIDASHSSMLSQPEKLASILLEIADRR